MTASAAPDPRLAKVHLAKRDLGLDDDTYRDVVERITGQRTSKGLGGAQLDALLAEFTRLGWQPGKTKAKGWRPAARHAHQRKAYALWGELKRRGIWREADPASLDRFGARVTGCDRVEWMKAPQSSKLIDALQAMLERGAPVAGAEVGHG